MNVLLVGPGGSVGKHESNLIRSEHPDWHITTHYSYESDASYERKLERCDVVCITISTKDNGYTAAWFIDRALSMRKYVATCEKGAMSEFPELFVNRLDRMRYSTTVGGPSGLTRSVHARLGITSMVAVVNATINSLSWMMSLGYSSDQAEESAFQRQIAEPESRNGIGIVNGEGFDARRKACILHFLAFPDVLVKDSMVSYSLQSGDRCREMLRRGQLVVRIGKRRDYPVKPKDPLFLLETETTYLFGEFVRQVPEFARMPEDIETCIVVNHASGTSYRPPMPGAGAKATAQAMLKEMEELEVLVNASR